jgi:predicted MFS family arabinose efflux permease
VQLDCAGPVETPHGLGSDEVAALDPGAGDVVTHHGGAAGDQSGVVGADRDELVARHVGREADGHCRVRRAGVDQRRDGRIVEVRHGLHTVSEVIEAERSPGSQPIEARPRWGAFALVCLAYLGVTVGEQALSPVMPGVAAEFGVTEGESAVAFGLLALSIAAANLVGGALIGRYGARALMLAGLATTAAGAVIAALANGFSTIVAAQVLLGAGAGLYFPAGLHAVPTLATGRRGFAMGIYGVAFSGGLTLAALLGTLGASHGWRVAFWSAAGLAVVAFVATWPVQLAPPTGAPVSIRFPLKAIVGLPTAIGAAGAVCQYGAIPFLTTFAVAEWGLRAGQAAGLLAIGRVVSILAKVLSGAGSDRRGPIVSARTTALVVGATGIAWVLLPAGWPAYIAAVVFAGAVSSFFPVANMVAVDYFGSNGPALGAYRSAQIGIGAAAGWLIGQLGEVVGLRSTLLVAVATPLVLAAALQHRLGRPI